MKESNFKFAIIIPAYNESESIVNVLNSVSKYGSAIVVDDGSIDRTANLAKDAGALVCSHKTNLGYDAALETGISKAIELNYQYAITIDADSQHDGENLKSFILAFNDGFDFAVGYRTKYQRPAEYLFAKIGYCLWGICDPLCGMKGYNLNKIKSFSWLCSYKSIGTELAIKCANSKLKLKNIQIVTRDRADVSRFGSGILPNLKILHALIYGICKYRITTYCFKF